MKRTVSFVLWAVVGMSAALSAHHSFSSYYLEDQSVTLEGDVVEFEYRAPHAWVRFNVADGQGRVNVYTPSGRTRHG